MSTDLIKIEKAIYKRLATQDKRWPITIWLSNNEKGFSEIRDWMDKLYAGSYPIVDHPRRLSELPTDPMCRLEFGEKLAKQISGFESIDDRVLFLQPYHYSEENLLSLDDYCKKNFLKHIEREYSPYYAGTKLIIVYESDNRVEEKIKQLLKDVDSVYES